ncbi:adenylate/guanylate cyclase domain-containing protein [bacterium]
MIKWKFFRSIIVVISLFVIGLSAVAARMFYDASAREARGRAKTIARSFSLVLPVLESSDGEISLRKIFQEFAEEHEVEYLYATDGEGNIVGFFSRIEAKDRILENAPGSIEQEQVTGKRLQVAGVDVLQVSLPVPCMEGREQLYITAGYSTQQLREDLREIGLITLLVLIVSGAAAFVVSLVVAGRFSKPIVQLTGNVEEVGRGNLEKVEPLKTGDELETLGDEINRMIEGLREREYLKHTFQRYLTKEIAEELLSDPSRIELGGEEKEVTIVFSDIREFTKISDEMSATDTMEFLNEYLKVMLDVVFKYEGTLDKFIGDAIMVLFGAPKSRPDDAKRAVLMAMEMQSALARLNANRAAAGKPEISIGIGINTGSVVAGNIGDSRRTEYTVVGYNVNLASRLEQLTKKYGNDIIISDTTYERVKDFVEVNELGEASIKGKELPIVVYELTGLKDNG